MIMPHFLQSFLGRVYMSLSYSRKRRRLQPDRDESFLVVLLRSQPFAQLDAKIARARIEDEPVLYAHVLPGLDVLLCSMRGAQPPYPDMIELRKRCMESITNALEQPLDGLENGGYWYAANGFGFLIYASRARARILPEFGAGLKTAHSIGTPPGQQNTGDAAPRSFG